MTLRFGTQAFMDREQQCLLITFSPFRIQICTADDVFDEVLRGTIRTPFVLKGERGDAAIGGFTELKGKARDIMIDHTVKHIEENRDKGLRTGIIPVLAPKVKPERGALLLLVAHDPDSAHVAEQKSYTDYKNLIEDFFDNKPGCYY